MTQPLNPQQQQQQQQQPGILSLTTPNAANSALLSIVPSPNNNSQPMDQTAPSKPAETTPNTGKRKKGEKVKKEKVPKAPKDPTIAKPATKPSRYFLFSHLAKPVDPSMNPDGTQKKPSKPRKSDKNLPVEIRCKRRRAANARERKRMNGLNDAFERLQGHIPNLGNDRKLSKFETLQMAQTYIGALRELLHLE